MNCANAKVCDVSYDGGYQEFMVAPIEAFARIPESLDPAEAAPLMCAGITTFNAPGIVALCRAISSPCGELMASVTWEFSSQRSLAIASQR